MKLTFFAGALTTRLVCIVAISMAVGAATIPTSVAAEDTSSVGIGIVPTEETDDQSPTREPDPTGTTESDPPPTEPVPTESTGGDEEQVPPDVTPTEEPDSGEGDGREDDAVAPGFVTLVIFTSDGNPTSAGTFACVGNVCQPAGGLASGTKVVFPDIDSGWNDVTVETGYRSGNASTSVQVASGQGSWVELTLVTPVGDAREDPEPTPVSRTGPLRSSPALASSDEQPPWSGDTVVSSMPVTGAASQSGPSSAPTGAPLLVASALVFAAVACALAARWTAPSRGN